MQRTTSQAYVLRSDHAKVPVQGREYRYIGENEWRETVYSFDGRGIEASVGRLDARELHEQAGVRPNAWCWPWDVHWGCVLVIAGAWAGTFAACAACVAEPTKLSCFACIGAVTEATGGTLVCTWCV